MNKLYRLSRRDNSAARHYSELVHSIPGVAMCGIVGFPDLKRQTGAGDLASHTEAMGDAQIHRDPDSVGVQTDEAAVAALAFHRLAIIDLSPEGAQPKISINGRYVLTFNGNTQSFEELRADMQTGRSRLRYDPDTEAILKEFAAWGIERLIGMFALALWDHEKRRLWRACVHERRAAGADI